MREALEGRPERQRTRRDYERVMDAYRVVYHGDPAASRADASISAVADMLAEQGRIFQDEKALHDAIRQYEFLRKEYPGSRYRFSALLTEGEIYLRDLNDREAARATFQQFLKMYPQNPLASEARAELTNLRKGAKSGYGSALVAEGRAGSGSPTPSANSSASSGAVAAPPKTASSRHNAVLTAALQSQGHSAGSGAVAQGKNGAVSGGKTPASKNAQRNEMEESDIPPPSNPAPSNPAAEPSRNTAKTEPPAEATIEHKIEPRTEPKTDASHLSEAALNAPPPPRRGKLPLVTGIRHWSTPVYTRVAIDLQDEVQYEAVRVPNPDRIFFDLHGTRLSPELIGKSDEVIDDGFLKQVRAAQFSNDVTRIVLDVSDVSEYSAFFLPNPSRLIIDVHGRKSHAPVVYTATVPPAPAPASTAKPAAKVATVKAPVAKTIQQPQMVAIAKPTIGIGPVTTAADALGDPLPASSTNAAGRTAARAAKNATALAKAPAATTKTPETTSASETTSATNDSSALADVASLSQQPNRVKATKRPTKAPVAQSVAGTSPAPQPDEVVAANAPPPMPAPSSRKSKKSSATAPADTSTAEIHAAAPTADGQRSMVRALGLKINRIVVDAGHGGHDSGTLGPDGIEEKDVVLDVALRLGKLLKERLGADVIYTRDDDTFIPLETRTAIANKAQADLFISIHGNSSPDSSARGVETYYLNFTTSADALEVAARENAVSDESIHQLSDLVKKIALQDKINESREFASDVEQSLYTGLEDGNPGLKDRGVKKAPFVVLIGANMPSILAEISFLTNPSDAQELREGQYRQRIAESLYHGVARYVGSLSGVRIADASPRGTTR